MYSAGSKATCHQRVDHKYRKGESDPVSVVEDRSDGVKINVYVQPRASKSEVVGVQDDALRVRIAAPPVDGAANSELIGLLRKVLRVRRSDIEILMGGTGRRKTILVRDRSASEVRKSLGLRRLD